MRREPVASSPHYLDVAFLLYIFPFARLALNHIPSELLTGRRLVYPGGILNRTTQCDVAIGAYTGSAATINNAIAACPAGQFVSLGAGTFNLSSGIGFSGQSNVILRGLLTV